MHVINHIFPHNGIFSITRERDTQRRGRRREEVLGSKVAKLSKIIIKILNAAEFIASDIQNIEAPRTDDHII